MRQPLDVVLENRRNAIIRHCEFYPLDGDPLVLIGWQRVFDLLREDLERLEFVRERCPSLIAARGSRL
ncbi:MULTISPECIES: hypothetical protein [unclassified Bradyrhizobium]|uniref:hypothetical protein n=1 Tax=unclassified Bradyrhizobium TaxID=2631580 RepID=UPI002479E457|nr:MULTISPECIES: hypothetical protein [unclassified Bradyrhizobium]WGS18951.1 hypothetical protein MTX22_31230 [Bradyrhizobium sp. ISRA463]WGS25784.1 hypothetical protein MTX19_28800 [Bradyrhizobium sp. ISRA464]